MKKLLLAGVVLAGFCAEVHADCVSGYTRKDGTYVQGYCRSTPNANRYDNYGSQSYGGSQRDEFSRNPATNKSNSSYGIYDNDSDGMPNSLDRTPNSGSAW